jgi:hypothetical protein
LSPAGPVRRISLVSTPDDGRRRGRGGAAAVPAIIATTVVGRARPVNGPPIHAPAHRDVYSSRRCNASPRSGDGPSESRTFRLRVGADRRLVDAPTFAGAFTGACPRTFARTIDSPCQGAPMPQPQDSPAPDGPSVPGRPRRAVALPANGIRSRQRAALSRPRRLPVPTHRRGVGTSGSAPAASSPTGRTSWDRALFMTAALCAAARLMLGAAAAETPGAAGWTISYRQIGPSSRPNARAATNPPKPRRICPDTVGQLLRVRRQRSNPVVPAEPDATSREPDHPRRRWRGQRCPRIVPLSTRPRSASSGLLDH